jgi:hypothetical protein
MVNKHDTTWRCVRCGTYTQTLHEVIFGRGNRQVCVDYHVQTPLCTSCHELVHTNKDKYVKELLNFLGVFGDDIHGIIQGVLVRRFRNNLEVKKDEFKMKIDSREIDKDFL